MPADRDSKSSSESPTSFQGLLSKCGIPIPSFSVRDKKISGGKERSEMPRANSPEKKRKRTPQNPQSQTTRTAVEMLNPLKKPAGQRSDATDVFGEYLRSKEHNQALQAYNEKHEKLLIEEADAAWDSKAINSATPAEKKAAIIIRSVREYERKVIFGNNASEAIPGPDTLDMGGQFLTNKTRIENRSVLFKITKDLPKGAILHLHFNAELNPERLLGEARSRENMYVWSKRALMSQEDLKETEMVFDVLPATRKSNSIFTAHYEGLDKNGAESWKAEKRHAQSQTCTGKCAMCNGEYQAYMKWSDFQKEFDSKFGKNYIQTFDEKRAAGNRLASEPSDVHLSPAENWIKQKMVLSESEAYRPTQTVNGVWARFNQATRCFKGLLNYKAVYEWYINAAIDRLIDEKIMYAELRPMLMDKTIPDTDGVKMLSLSEQMQLITDCVHKKLKEKDNNEREKREHFPFGLKIIYCTPRSIPKPKMQDEMRDCIRLKEEFPDLICGFDLVGAEDRPNHIGFYKEELVAFKETCKKKNLEIPFMFHAGETLLDTGGSSDPQNSNLFDAVALESKRIGHGFALLKHPKLIERFRQEKDKKTRAAIPGTGICIELCPISNELLHLCRNVKEHPYPELLAAGIPCCVNSDNPSLFGNSMSHEFYQIMVGSPTVSLHSWKQLALWSLEYSCLSKSESAKAKDIFLESFKGFCAEVVRKYGKHVDLETPGGRVKDSIDQEYSTSRTMEADAEDGRHELYIKGLL